MFWYSVPLLLACFTPIKAFQNPEDPIRDVVSRQEFNDWGCGTICNDDNKGRIQDWCVKLSGTQDPDKEQSIRQNSWCTERRLQLINDSLIRPMFYDEEVGFCDMGPEKSDKKCITKSIGDDDILVWDGEGPGIKQYCVPKYEKKGWFAKNGEKQ